MPNHLLITWEVIHKTLFIDDDGRILLSLSSLMQKYGPGLKASGAIKPWVIGRGRARYHVVAGWKNTIENYFIRLGQKEDAARRKAKRAKKTVSIPDKNETQSTQSK